MLGAAAACRGEQQSEQKAAAPPTSATPGAPPAFNTSQGVGPEVAPATFAEAEKLVEVPMTPAEREMASKSWRTSMAPLLERRVGPRKIAIPSATAPATIWNPVLPGMTVSVIHDRFVRSKTDPGPLPASDEDIAFAPVTKLARWVEQKKITSTRLTNIYLERLQRFDPKLH